MKVYQGQKTFNISFSLIVAILNRSFINSQKKMKHKICLKKVKEINIEPINCY
jgi:hypothetical protein